VARGFYNNRKVDLFGPLFRVRRALVQYLKRIMCNLKNLGEYAASRNSFLKFVAILD